MVPLTMPLTMASSLWTRVHLCISACSWPNNSMQRTALRAAADAERWGPRGTCPSGVES